MDKVLSSCRDGASTYIDDVLVYSADCEGRSNSNADGMSRQAWKDAQKPDGDEGTEKDREIVAMDGAKTTGGECGIDPPVPQAEKV